MSEKSINRRSLLKLLGGTLATPVLLKTIPISVSAQSSLSPLEFRNRLDGAVCSIPTVYNADFSLDHQGFRNIIEMGVKAGSKVFTLTSGNNQYDRLTYEEIKQLTKTFIEGVAGRGLTIAATGQWWTGQAVDYAKYAKSLGADAVQVHLPAYGEENILFKHFQEIAKAGPPSIVLHGQVPLPLLEKLVTIEAVTAYKEEYPPIYSRDVFDRYGKRINIFAGGQKGTFLMYRPYGMKAWYSTLSTFAPEVVKKFTEAHRKNDEKTMAEIVMKYDVAFFRKWSHAFWRAVLEANGTAKRWLRPPDKSFSDDEVKEAAKFLQNFGK